MGKKKTVKVTETPKESSIQYAGNVTLKFMQGNKVLRKEVHHNTCTLAMLELICNAMAGKLDGAPQYMGIGKNNSATDITDTGLHDEVAGGREIVVAGSTESKLQDNVAVGKQCVLTATFPYALLNVTSSIGELGLFRTKAEQDLLARVVFPNPITLGETDKNVSLYVEWTLSVVNDSSNTEVANNG